MKRTIIAIAVISLFSLALAVGCDDVDSEQVAGEQEVAVAETASVELDLDGMTCVSCAASIEDAFDEADAIAVGDVDFGQRRAHVEYDADVLDESAIIEIVEEAGFEASIADGDS